MYKLPEADTTAYFEIVRPSPLFLQSCIYNTFMSNELAATVAAIRHKLNSIWDDDQLYWALMNFIIKY